MSKLVIYSDKRNALIKTEHTVYLKVNVFLTVRVLQLSAPVASVPENELRKSFREPRMWFKRRRPQKWTDESLQPQRYPKFSRDKLAKTGKKLICS